MLTLEEIKAFIGYDTDAHDALLTTFKKAAEEYLKDGVNKNVDLNDSRAKTLMLILIKEMVESGDTKPQVSTITQRLISSFTLQLSLESEAKEENRA